MREELKACFGDIVENGWASTDNPTRVGIFVREGRRPRGRMNPGRFWQITDGKGKFWELSPVGDHRISVRPPEVAVRVDGGSSGAESGGEGLRPFASDSSCQSEGDVIHRAAAVEACSEWLRQYGDKEITFTSARQHASDAVMDIRDHIRSLPSSDSVKTEAWSAIIDRIVPALAPMSDATANRYPAEWMLWKDRERIRAELAALSSEAPTPEVAGEAAHPGKLREEQQNPPPKETTGKVEGEG